MVNFNEYPYRNLTDLNLDYLEKKMNVLKEIMDTFVTLNTVTFADPIIWNITTQYSRNTVVLDTAGNAYLSKEVVPAGVQLNNSDYWLEIFNFTEYTRTANQNLTVNVETNTTRATAEYNLDDWLIWNDVLYKVTTAIAIDDALIVAPDAGANISHFTVEDFIKAFMTWATNTIQQYKNDIDASELLYRQQLAGDIANTTASLQAQLNAAIAGATVDSEVINARIGANGYTYSTLGEAIRRQILSIYNAIPDFIVPIVYTPTIRVGYAYNKPNGAGSTSSYLARIDVANVGDIFALTLQESPAYKYFLTYGDSTYTGSGQGTGYIGYTDDVSGFTYLPYNAEKIGITFIKVDGTAITANDVQIISGLLKAYSITDKSLTLPNKAADAKTVGLFNGLFRFIEHAIGGAYKFIENAGITSNGVIAQASTVNLMCFKVKPYEFVSATGNFDAYGFFTDEPMMGSVTYNGSQGGSTFNLVQVPSGCSWVAFRTTQNDVELMPSNDLLHNGSIIINANNKANYFTDCNDAPINSIFGIAANAEIANSPYGEGISTGAGVYDGTMRSITGYPSGFLATIRVGNADAQYFLTRSNTHNNDILWFRTKYQFTSNWTEWICSSSKTMLTSSNFAIRKKFIAPYIDSQGNPTATDTGIANPQYMTDPTVFKDFNDAPRNSIYQIDLDCDSTVMANNPRPGRSSVLITMNFSYMRNHGEAQFCIGVSHGEPFIYCRYGYLDDGMQFTPWANLNKIPDAPTSDGNYILHARVVNGVVTYSWN